jgi:hypothetical protein
MVGFAFNFASSSITVVVPDMNSANHIVVFDNDDTFFAAYFQWI